MTRTPVLRTAYNKSMQPVILLVLLMFAQQPDFGASLQKFLAFYRENRELLAALAGEIGAAGPRAPRRSFPAAPPPQPPAQEKSRPEEGGNQADILQTYLKNAAVH